MTNDQKKALSAAVGIVLAAFGGGGYLGGSAVKAKDDQQAISSLQDQLAKANTTLDSIKTDLNKANIKIANILTTQTGSGKKSIDPEGVYIWQVIDEKQTWKGEINVDHTGAVTSLDMKQHLSCKDGMHNVPLLRLQPNAWLKPEAKSAKMNVSIPVQFFTYSPGNCENSQIDEKILEGSLVPTIAYVGDLRYHTQSSGESGNVVIVRKPLSK